MKSLRPSGPVSSFVHKKTRYAAIFAVFIITLQGLNYENSWATTTEVPCSGGGKYFVVDGEARSGGSSGGNCVGDPKLDIYNLDPINSANIITRIGISAFQQSGIEILNIPIEVESIADYAFADIPTLAEVTIQNPNIVLGRCVFQYDASLSRVNLPEGMTRIGISMFAGASSLTSITLPSTLLAIACTITERCIESTIGEAVAIFPTISFILLVKREIAK